MGHEGWVLGLVWDMGSGGWALGIKFDLIMGIEVGAWLVKVGHGE